MTRVPALSRDEMNAAQKELYDAIAMTTGRVGRGPSVGYSYSPGLWRLHDDSSAHLRDCSLTPAQVRIVSLLTVRHWKARYPWSAQAVMALAAGLDPAAVEAINSGERPAFTDAADAAVFDVACELLASGTLGDASFGEAAARLGYERLADIVGAIGHFCTTAMMANVVGAEPASDAPSLLNP
jgi:4-carboxymuconolactone decarboxylase